MKRMLELREAVGGRETRSFAVEIKATGDDGTVEGYGSVFGVKDAYDDVIVPGAFKESLSEHKTAGTMPAMLWQHDGAEPIGIWSDMSEDEKGLKIKGKLSLETVRGREAHALLKMGALNGLSIGFVCTAKSYNDKDGTRTITGIDLWEVSLVTFPANRAARVTGVKSEDPFAAFTKPSDAERWLREAAGGSMSKSDATAFVASVMRMGEERREAAQSAATLKSAADRLLSSISNKE